MANRIELAVLNKLHSIFEKYNSRGILYFTFLFTYIKRIINFLEDCSISSENFSSDF